jgi:hypothetical protein
MKKPAPTIPMKRSTTAIMMIIKVFDIRHPPLDGFVNAVNSYRSLRTCHGYKHGVCHLNELGGRQAIYAHRRAGGTLEEKRWRAGVDRRVSIIAQESQTLDNQQKAKPPKCIQ